MTLELFSSLDKHSHKSGSANSPWGAGSRLGARASREHRDSFSSCRDLASPTPACPTFSLTKWNERALDSTGGFSESREGTQGKWNECNSWDAWNLNRVGFLLLSFLNSFQGKISRLVENITDFQNKPIFYSLYVTEIEINKLFKKKSFSHKDTPRERKEDFRGCPAIRLVGVLPSASLDPWKNNK